MIELSERKILITGASSGIGRATAVLASRLGASVVLCGRDKQRLEETKEMMECPDRHICIAFDVRDFERYDDVFHTAVSDGKKLNGLVHCAGIAKPTPLRMMKASMVHETMDVNFLSFMCLSGLYSKKKFSDGGSIVAVSSVNVHYPRKCMSVYAASKAAIEASVKTMALELVDRNIRINCVVPGGIRTPMIDVADENTRDAINAILERQLLGVGRPEDVANMIAFLLSDASALITGRAMFVDGGILGQ